MKEEELHSQLDFAETRIISGDYKEGESLTQEVLDHIANLDTNYIDVKQKTILLAKAYLNHGFLKQRQGNFPMALDFTKKASDLATEFSHLEQDAKAQKLNGLINTGLGNFDKGLEFFSKAQSYYEELGDIEALASVQGNIANVYYKLENYEKAKEIYTKLISIYEERGNKIAASSVLGNLASAYFALKEIEKSIEIQNRALKTNQELGRKPSVANCKHNLGNAYFVLKDFKNSLEYYLDALEDYKMLDQKANIVDVIYSLANVYAKEHSEYYNPKLAEEYYLDAMSQCEKNGIKQLLYQTQYWLSDLYKNLGRWEESRNYYERFHRTEKEVLSAAAKNKADQIEQQRIAAEREKVLEIERATEAARLGATRTLLHKILPETISDRMVGGEETISDYYPSASILFADMVGFTTMSSQMNALDVGKFLNYVFSEFDNIMKKHGCEKIKTMGDGYMAASGLPIASEDHEERLAKAALEMLLVKDLPKEIVKYIPKEAKIDFRIGLHTGPVLAGVIGKEKFIYDIYSDAVNIASRMESHGAAGRVHISEDFKTALSSTSLQFESRGVMDIKGKGQMKTYFIIV